MRKLLISVLLALSAASAVALETKKLEVEWNPVYYATTTSAATSTHAITAIAPCGDSACTGFSYLLYSSSSNFTYQVVVTTKNAPSNAANLSPTFSTSTLLYGYSGVPVNGTWDTLAISPKIIVTDLNPAATIYVQIDAGSLRNWR